MSEMELGSIEFKADDVDMVINKGFGETILDEDNCEEVAEKLNAILRSRLKDAPRVYAVEPKNHMDVMKWTASGWVNIHKDQDKRIDTHTALLICIHPLSESKE